MDNITLVSDHVLIPHQADWTKTPDMERIWRSNVDKSLANEEDRLSVRENAWKNLSYQVLPFNHVEHSRFQVRMREAHKRGKIAVPFFGRGIRITSDASASDTVLTLEFQNHRISANDYVFIQPATPAEFDTWDVGFVVSTSGYTITLAAGLDNAYSDGTYVWPLLFGKPEPNNFRLINTDRGIYDVTVLFDQRILNVLQGNEDFSQATVGTITDLVSGDGLVGNWGIYEYGT